MSKAKIVTIAVTPKLTGSISFAASVTIIISILRSDVKLSTSYRRLLFGVSVYDLIQSISQVASSIPMPLGTSWLASGNYTTCSIQGFTTAVGLLGAITYSVSLTVYFLLIVKYAEPFLHAVPIILSSVLSIYALATSNFSTDNQLAVCTFNMRPLNCDSGPDVDVDCISKQNVNNKLALILSSLLVLTFALNCIIMAIICLAVHFQIRKSHTYRYSWMTSIKSPTPGGALRPDQVQEDDSSGSSSMRCATFCKSCFDRICSLVTTTSFTRRNRQEIDQQSTSPLAARLSRPSQASVRRLKETSRRAISYVIGFLLTYTFGVIQRLITTFGSAPAPFTIIFLAKFFFPLQGFFNVLVYTYPHVVSYQRNHSEHSWIRAFWEVVKSGGDSDRIQLSPGRRRSLGKQKKALAIENSKKKENTPGGRNSSSGGGNILIAPSPFDAAQLVRPAIELPAQREDLSYIELNDAPKGVCYSASEEEYGEETSVRNDIREENSTNNDLFPIASSTLMKSDSSNWVTSSNSKNGDDEDSYDSLF